MNSIVKNQNNAVSFLTPSNLQEAMQIAGILAESDIVPKDYQRKPGNIMVAMQWGAEIGLQPLQAMQNIAVINGRPSIWGDAMLALVRSSGLLDSIREELSDDGQTATCTVKRKNEEPVVSIFTMEDAKKAGLTGKQGPWTQYPKRMLKLRARSYALRDVFPDVIKGMGIAEEEKDKEIDITPTATSVSAESKSNSGTSALKSRLAKKQQAVESIAQEIDLTPFYTSIKNAQSLEELNKIGDEIAALGLGEPAKSQIGDVFKEKRTALRDKLITAIDAELDAANTADDLGMLWETRVAPLTNQMTEEQLNFLSATYERKEAELSE